MIRPASISVKGRFSANAEKHGFSENATAIRRAGFDRVEAGPHVQDLYQAKCSVLFEHVYESYLGDGASVYSAAV